RLVRCEKMARQNAPCHWCNKPLVWRVSKGGADSLCADHLDGDPTNDHPDNLVPACRFCNAMRERAGKWSALDEVDCPTCGDVFKPASRRMRFCSKRCGRGGQASNAQVDPSMVRSIQRRLEAGCPVADIAKDFRVSEQIVRRINRGHTWSHV